MGACGVSRIVEGTDVEEIWDAIVKDCIREYGEDSYNGTFSTTRLCGKIKSFPKCTKSVEKEARAIVTRMFKNDEVRKWQSYYIDLGVTGYLVTQVKKETVKADDKFRLKYCVIKEAEFSRDDRVIKSFATKKEADDKMLSVALKEHGSYHVERRYVNEGKSPVTTRCKVSNKIYKSKPKLKAMDNRKIEEIHKYLFFGMAAE